jgi:hypothetical protein
MAQIVAVQGATNDTLHHAIAQLNALLFNASDAGRRQYGGHGHGCTCRRGHGHNPPAYVRGPPQGGGFPLGDCFHPTMGTGGHSQGLFPPSLPGGFQGGLIGGPSSYHAPPPVMNGGYSQNGGYGILTYPPGMPPAQVHKRRCTGHGIPTWSNIMQIRTHATHAGLMSWTAT